MLISIGYSACHWCHVMERESFEDEQVARIMNDHFVCIKVDREERPDIDHIYMNAVQLLSGRGGWPLNCFALPDGRPFWGATYFPKDQWISVLSQINDLFQNRYDELEKQGDELTRGVAGSTLLKAGQKQEDSDLENLTEQIAGSILDSIDMQEGGTKGAPKFPMPVIYDFMMHFFVANPDHPKSKQIWDAVKISLEKMALGGIYDQIGGGFARYSTDEIWKVPHFEKMLYDNAQLVSVYSKAYRIQPDPLFKQVVFETIGFVQRELTSEYDTFYSALDADSEGEEGKFYVWKKAEFENVIPEQERQMASDFFQVGRKGLWEKGNNILLLEETLSDFADKHDLDEITLREMVNDWKSLLLKEREKRVRPGLDNKVLVSWNALMVEGLSEAYKTFGEEKFRTMAVKGADFLIRYAIDDGGKLSHSLSGTDASIDGFLEDYAALTSALTQLNSISGTAEYLEVANQLTRYVLENFTHPDTPLFSFNSNVGEQLVAPFYELFDNVIPSSNSIMARNLFYLGHFFEDHQLLERTREMIASFSDKLTSSWSANWGILALQLSSDFYTLAALGNQLDEELKGVHQRFHPKIQTVAARSSSNSVPVFQNRFDPDKKTFYLCTSDSCLAPLYSAREVTAKLDDIR
jgi:uncharacterized protein YyaL (SSP411 family)